MIYETIGRLLAGLSTEAAAPVEVAQGSAHAEVEHEAGRGDVRHEAGELSTGSASPAMPAAPAAEVEHEAAPIVHLAAVRARAGARKR